MTIVPQMEMIIEKNKKGCRLVNICFPHQGIKIKKRAETKCFARPFLVYLNLQTNLSVNFILL